VQQDDDDRRYGDEEDVFGDIFVLCILVKPPAPVLQPPRATQPRTLASAATATHHFEIDLP
jgi:hypothetical protein